MAWPGQAAPIRHRQNITDVLNAQCTIDPATPHWVDAGK